MSSRFRERIRIQVLTPDDHSEREIAEVDVACRRFKSMDSASLSSWMLSIRSPGTQNRYQQASSNRSRHIFPLSRYQMRPCHS
jgi:hypothetical protein